VPVRYWEALNLSTDDACRRHVAIDDALEQARILIAYAKGGDCPRPGFDPGPSRSRTVSVPCPPVSDRLPRRPREYEIDQAGVLW
jgi:hypothetical protein